MEKNGPTMCTFGSTLIPRFPLKMAEIEKNNYQQQKTSAIGLSKYVKTKAISSLSFPGKI